MGIAPGVGFARAHRHKWRRALTTSALRWLIVHWPRSPGTPLAEREQNIAQFSGRDRTERHGWRRLVIIHGRHHRRDLAKTRTSRASALSKKPTCAKRRNQLLGTCGKRVARVSVMTLCAIAARPSSRCCVLAHKQTRPGSWSSDTVFCRPAPPCRTGQSPVWSPAPQSGSRV